MNDIMPPPKKRPLSPPQTPMRPPLPPMEAINETASIPPLQPDNSPRPKKRLLWWTMGGVVVLIAAIIAAGIGWYQLSLRPLDSANKSRIRIQIAGGSSPSEIGQLLQEKGIIRHHLTFEIYTRLTGVTPRLQAGVYSLSPSESMATIVNHLASGNTDAFTITFLPGATLAEDREAFIKAGYESTEVDAALQKVYQHPLLADKPAADLEGYIYGETYQFDSDATVEGVLKKTFDEYYKKLTDNNLVEAYTHEGLTLYQAITLASIIQREVSDPADQQQVAQVFLKRLSINMPLGSDVTYQYAAKKLSVVPSPDLDSPYNTRKYPGLPPGPIAMPGLSALKAVAQPASGDYLYFLSGDNDVTYFSHTQEEHEANIRAHCQIKCSQP